MCCWNIQGIWPYHMVSHRRHQKLIEDSFCFSTSFCFCAFFCLLSWENRLTCLTVIILCFSGLQSQADDSLLRYPRSPSLQPAGDAWQLKHICFKGAFKFLTTLRFWSEKGYSCSLRTLLALLLTYTITYCRSSTNRKRKPDNHCVISFHNKTQQHPSFRPVALNFKDIPSKPCLFSFKHTPPVGLEDGWHVFTWWTWKQNTHRNFSHHQSLL